MSASKDGFRLKLEVDGTNLVREELDEIGKRARDAKPVLRVIQELMARGAREQFETKGARGGLPWVPDTEHTVTRKAREGHETETERRTNTLYESLMAAKGGGDAIRRLSKASTTFGTRVFYAQFQGHKRRLLEITTADADDWAERMVKYILTGEVDV